MKAVAYSRSLPVEQAQSLQDIKLPVPVATGRDLLVKILAIAANPVDYKIRQRMSPPEGEPRVLGWDAVGEVVAAGEAVSGFSPGDLVFYAGDLNRPGCNAEFQLVDERLVGRKPRSLSNAEAAALPLTAITAWEMLFEHLGLQQIKAGGGQPSEETILVIGAAGGVGSILVQLAKALTGATVIGTASRESTWKWVRDLGADHVIDHSRPLQPQLEALDVGPLTRIASLTHTDAYFDSYVEILAPFGRIAMIDDPATPLDPMKLKLKSLSLHVEFMFARSMFDARDMAEQGRLLNRVAELVDAGRVRSTVGKNLGAINAENLRAAHAELESGKSIGKIVLEGF